MISKHFKVGTPPTEQFSHVVVPTAKAETGNNNNEYIIEEANNLKEFLLITAC